MKLTDALNQEYESVERTIQSQTVSTSSKDAVQKITKMYESILEKKLYSGDAKSMTNSRLNILRTKYSIEDITAFSQTLKKYTKEESFQELTGRFLTRIIMKHYEKEPTEREYVLVLKDIDCTINNLGISLDGPNIVVLGNVGRNLGMVMKSGSIKIIGNAEELVGFEMTGGSIIVEGNTEKFTGATMMGGKIFIKGNTDSGLGLNMRNGEISVDGTIGSIGRNITGGKIYNKGKLYYPQIFDNEEWNKKIKEELKIMNKET